MLFRSEAIHEAEAAFRGDRPDEATAWALVTSAIARRPFLAGDTTPWCDRPREHLRHVRVRALEVRGNAGLARGDHVGAATDAEAVLELDPYRESAHALLMKAHVAEGNPANALAAYERLRVKLAEDLGTSPSPETEAVFLDVLAMRG